MSAIIKTGGKQYRVEEGAVVTVEKLPVGAGSEVTFDQVLCVGNPADGAASGGWKVGTPTVPGASVVGEVLTQGRGPKLVVYKKRPKKGYEVKTGHRQLQTRVRIARIVTAPIVPGGE